MNSVTQLMKLITGAQWDSQQTGMVLQMEPTYIFSPLIFADCFFFTVFAFG